MISRLGKDYSRLSQKNSRLSEASIRHKHLIMLKMGEHRAKNLPVNPGLTGISGGRGTEKLDAGIVVAT